MLMLHWFSIKLSIMAFPKNSQDKCNSYQILKKIYNSKLLKKLHFLWKFSCGASAIIALRAVYIGIENNCTWSWHLKLKATHNFRPCIAHPILSAQNIFEERALMDSSAADKILITISVEQGAFKGVKSCYRDLVSPQRNRAWSFLRWGAYMEWW